MKSGGGHEACVKQQGVSQGGEIEREVGVRRFGGAVVGWGGGGGGG
eukprot:COSAG04_NODE_2775_length_3601_cov_2.652484_7_plen_45_part_01